MTKEFLKSILQYNKETGLFIWKIKPCKKIAINSIAGTITKAGYIQIRINKKNYYGHRLAFLYISGKNPKIIDHINHDRSDNRYKNLRSATVEENQKNKSKMKNNKTGVTGVCYVKKSNSYVVYIGKKYLGSSPSFKMACNIRMIALENSDYHENHK